MAHSGGIMAAGLGKGRIRLPGKKRVTVSITKKCIGLIILKIV